MTCAFTLAGRTNLRVPDVDALVEGAAGEVPAVGAEGHAVDGLLVAGQGVDAHAALHVPQTHRGVKRRAAESGTTSEIRFDPIPSRIAAAAAPTPPHLASMRLALGLLVPGPVGLHLMV